MAKDSKIPNPNGANGTTSDPREQICWDIYVENLSQGIDNAYKAAIEAGYEDKTARQITVRRWFIERNEDLERKNMLSDAEKVLRKTLRYKTDEVDDKGVEKIKVDLLRVQADVAKTIVTTLGKKHYSNKGEDGITKLAESVDSMSSLSNEELDAIIKGNISDYVKNNLK